MKAVLILSVSGLMTVFAFYIVWMNRASEKILSAIFPVAVAALTGVILAVFVFGGEPATTTVFPSSFQYRLPSKMPLQLPLVLMNRRFSQTLFAPTKLFEVHPEFFNDAADLEGQSLYHHLLQRAIIDWMGLRYANTWQVEMLQFDLPVGREGRFGPIPGASEKSVTLSTKQIEKLLEGNRFAKIHAGIPPRIALPPGTRMKITPPQAKTGLESGEILLENDFCTVSINTQFSSWLRGIGSYKRLAGISDEDNQNLATSNYTVRINVGFDRLRSNHPKMGLYKTWVSQLSEGIREQFDEQLIWSKTKEDFVFSQMEGRFEEQSPLHSTTLLPDGSRTDAVIGGVAHAKQSAHAKAEKPK
jgi:hypothetical protein